MNAFWWQGDHIGGSNNWGDIFTPFLFQKMYDITLVSVQPHQASLICIGSILEVVTPSFRGHILGTGFIHQYSKRDLSNAVVHLLRGKLTKEHCTGAREDIPVGDPGILAHLFAKPTEKKFRYGIIPHYIDKNVEQIKSLGPDVLNIDVQAGVQEVIDAASQCENLVASSLHGVILADALGIPNCWVKLSGNLTGNDFKFADYYSAYDERPIVVTSIIEAFKLCRTRDTSRVKESVLNAVNKFVGLGWRYASTYR